MRWIYLNGELVRQETATVSALDRGLLYGYGLFETMRSYGGRVFRLEQHYQRLRDGAARLAMDVPLTLRELSDAVEIVLQRNELSDARVRLMLTAGAEGAAGSVVLLAREVTEYPRQLYRRGMSALVSSMRRNETSFLSGVKSFNYLDNLLAREDARRQGADEAIILNTRGLVAEGSASNMFLVLDGRLVTPNLSSGCLAGITRQAVLELAAAAELEPVESEVEPSAFEDASEAFLTGSVMEVM
ncbi:MAG: aminotransferase class IV, partial [Chloroflexi bacterium]|nr:aminotransferase class IV [Chloroflexota bacterium]